MASMEACRRAKGEDLEEEDIVPMLLAGPLRDSGTEHWKLPTAAYIKIHCILTVHFLYACHCWYACMPCLLHVQKFFHFTLNCPALISEGRRKRKSYSSPVLLQLAILLRDIFSKHGLDKKDTFVLLLSVNVRPHLSPRP